MKGFPPLLPELIAVYTMFDGGVGCGRCVSAFNLARKEVSMQATARECVSNHAPAGHRSPYVADRNPYRERETRNVHT